jgi:hypothetical protein
MRTTSLLLLLAACSTEPAVSDEAPAVTVHALAPDLAQAAYMDVQVYELAGPWQAEVYPALYDSGLVPTSDFQGTGRELWLAVHLPGTMNVEFRGSAYDADANVLVPAFSVSEVTHFAGDADPVLLYFEPNWSETNVPPNIHPDIVAGHDVAYVEYVVHGLSHGDLVYDSGVQPIADLGYGIWLPPSTDFLITPTAYDAQQRLLQVGSTLQLRTPAAGVSTNVHLVFDRSPRGI